MEDNKTRVLYDRLTQDGYDIGDFDSFSKNVQDEAKRKSLYETITNDGYDVGDFDSFSSKLVARSQEEPVTNVTTQNVHPEQPQVQPVQDMPSYDPKTQGYILDNVPDMFRSKGNNLATRPLPQQDLFENNPSDLVRKIGIDQQQRVEQAQKSANDPYMKEQNLELFKRQNQEQINSVNELINAARQERAKERQQRVRSVGDGGIFSTISQAYLAGEQNDTDKQLEYASTLMEQAQNITNEAKKKGNTNFFSGFARGFKDALLDGWAMGLQDLKNYSAAKKVMDKVDKGEELTPSEDALMQALVTNAATQMYYAGDLGRGYKAGGVTAESLPFMLDMIAGMGAVQSLTKPASKAIVKYAADKAAQMGLGRATTGLAKGAARTVAGLGDVAAHTATFGSARVAADYQRRGLGNVQVKPNADGTVSYDGRENVQTGAEALGKSIISTAAETGSELLGEYFAPMLGYIGRVTGANKVGKIIPASVGKAFKDVVNSQGFREMQEIARRTKISDPLGEYAEEVANNLVSTAIGDMTPEQLVDLDQNIDTFLGVAPMSALFGAAGTGGYLRDKYKNYRNMRNFETQMQDAMGEDWSGVREALQDADIETARNMVKDVLSSPMSPGMKKNAIKYISSVLQEQTLQEADKQMMPEEIAVEKRNIINNLNETRSKISLNDKELNAIINSEEGYQAIISQFDPETANNIMKYKQAYDDFVNYNYWVQDQADNARRQAEAQVESLTNATTGTIMRVNSGLSTNPVNILRGNLVFDNEGKVDENQSDKTIYYMSEDGRVKMAPVSMFSSLVDNTPAEEMIQRAGNDAQEEVLQAEEAQINSIPAQEQQPIEPETRFTMGGNNYEVNRVTPDGYEVYLLDENGTPAQSQLMSEEEIRNAINGQQPANAEETQPSVTEQPVQEETSEQPVQENQTAMSRIPLNERGEQDFEAAPVADTSAALLEISDNVDDAKDTATQMIDHYNNELKKAEKAKSTGNTIQEIVKMKQEKKANIKAINDKISYWNQVAADLEAKRPTGLIAQAEEKAKENQQRLASMTAEEQQAAQQEVQKKIDAGAFERKEPRKKVRYVKEDADLGPSITPQEHVLREIATGRVSFSLSDTEGAQGLSSHLGYSNSPEERKKLVWALSSDGLTPEAAAEQIHADMPENLQGMVTDQDVFNMIINAFQEYGSPSKMWDAAKNMHGTDIEENIPGYEEDQERQLIEWEASENRMSVPEWIAYSDYIEEELNNLYSSVTDEELNTIFEQIINDYERRAETESAGSTEGQTDSEQGNTVQPERESDNEGRTGEVEEQPEPANETDGESGSVVPEPEGTVKTDIEAARAEVDQNPTEAQKEAGNYKKGHVKIDGYDVTIENPKGSVRSGKDADGNEWSVTMNNDYGYIRGTEGVDGDHIDIFLSDNPESGNVYVIDQVDQQTGMYDESKVMYGFNSIDEARDAYLANYEEGWKVGVISEVSKEEFKKWIESSTNKIKPFSEYKNVDVISAQNDGSAKDIQPVNENSVVPVNELPRRLREAYESGSEKDISNAENELRSYIENAEDVKMIYSTYFYSKELLNKKDILSPSGKKMHSFIVESCKKALEQKGIPGQVLSNERSRVKAAERTDNAFILELMSYDNSQDVVRAVINNPNTSESVLRQIEERFKNNGLNWEAKQVLNKRKEARNTQPKENIVPVSEKETTTNAEDTPAKSNNIVSDERYQELKNRLKQKLGQLNAGIDPEIIAIGAEMAVYHIERGAVKFADYCKAMVDDLGDVIRPYLKSFYSSARYMPQSIENGLSERMSPDSEVSQFDVTNFDKSVPDVMQQIENVAKEKEIEKATSSNDVKKSPSDLFGNSEEYQKKAEQEKEAVSIIGVKIAEKAKLENSEDVRFREDYDTTFFRDVTDLDEIDRLEREPKIKVYRAMQVINGKLYPPMMAAINGQLVSPRELGTWEVADERPEAIKYTKKNKEGEDIGYVDLDKATKDATGKKATKVSNVAYNPYWHTSHTMLNDQFTSAWIRPNLVTVEVEVPLSELTSGYRAEYAKNSVGEVEWKSGPVSSQLAKLGKPRRVVLSRWDKPIRVVPESEVAQHIKDLLGDSGIEIPENVVTPKLKQELEKIGVKIGNPQKGIKKTEQIEDALQAGLMVDNSLISEKDQLLRYIEGEGKEVFNYDVRNTSQKLGLPVEIIHSIDEVPEGSAKEAIKKGRKVKGWYSLSDNKVYVYLPNATSMEDVNQTILHEGVAHYGLRQLVGEDRMDDFLDDVFANVTDEVRKKIIDTLPKYGYNSRIATEEYMARMAENGVDVSVWQRIKQAFNSLMRRMGINIKISDNELRYILWRSRQNLDKNRPLDLAKDVAMQYQMGVGNYFREVDQTPEQSIIDAWDNIASSTMFSLRESTVDYLTAIDKFQDLISKRTGEEIKSFENAYDSMTFLSSKNRVEMDWYDSNIVTPMRKAILELVGKQKGRKWDWNKGVLRQLVMYVEAKHGSERNRQMAIEKYIKELKPESLKFFENAGISIDRDKYKEDLKKAKEEAGKKAYDKSFQNIYDKLINEGLQKEEAESQAKKRAKVIADRAESNASEKFRNDFRDKLMKEYSEKVMSDWNDTKKRISKQKDISWIEKQRELDREASRIGADLSQDYSGLSSVFGDEKEYPDGWYESSLNFVEEYENNHNETSIGDLWKSISQATDYTLNKQYESGLVSKEYVDRQKQRFENYIPLRGFQDEIAGDVYNYIGNDFYPGSNPVKSAKGRTSEAGNPFGSILNTGYSTISVGNKNLAKMSLYSLVNNHDTEGLAVSNRAWMVRYDKLMQDDDLMEALVIPSLEAGEDIPEWVEAVPKYPEGDISSEEVSRILGRFEDLMKKNSKEGYAKPISKRSRIAYRTLYKERSEHEIPLYILGDKYVITITGNPRVAQAMNGLLNPNVNNKGWAEIGERMQRFMAGAFTAKNAAFSIANLTKDSMYANNQVFIKENIPYWIKFTKKQKAGFGDFIPMMMRLKKYRDGNLDLSDETNKMFKEFMDNGGATGYTFVDTQEKYAKELADKLKELSKSKFKVVDPRKLITAFFDSVEFTGQAAELVNRFAAYQTSRDMGRSVTRSIRDAKEITVNFNRKGAGMKSWDDKKSLFDVTNMAAFFSQYGRAYILFWNANMQAKYRFYKNIKEHPIKTSTTLIGNPMMFASVLVPFMNNFVLPALYEMFGIGSGDDDEDYYNTLTDWERTHNICIRLPYGNWLKIPLSPEMSPWYTIGDCIGGAIAGQRELSASDFIKSGIDAISPLSINWSYEGANVILNVLPTISQPVAQVAMNVNFMGNPIKKQPFTMRQGFAPQYTMVYGNTSPTLIELSRLSNKLTGGTDSKTSGPLDWNPALLQNVITGYTGGYGSSFLSAADWIVSTLKGEEQSSTIGKMPLVSRFFISGNKDVKIRRINSSFYDVIKFTEEFKFDQKSLENQMNNSLKEGNKEEYMKSKKQLEELLKSDRAKKYIQLDNIVDSTKDFEKYLKEMPDDETTQGMLYQLKSKGLEILKK